MTGWFKLSHYQLKEKFLFGFVFTFCLIISINTLSCSVNRTKAEKNEAWYPKLVELAGFLPENAGELIKNPDFSTYNSKNLYNYLNGGAEHYFNNGFVCLLTQNYQYGEKTVIVEIYQFEDQSHTKKIYLEAAAKNRLNIGTQGSYGKCYLIFYFKNFIVKCMCFNVDSNAVLIKISKEIEKFLQRN